MNSLTELLREAERAVTDAGVSDDLRPAAFSVACDYLVGPRAPDAVPAPQPREFSVGLPGSTPMGDVLSRIAAAAAVDVSRLSYVYEEDETGVRLVVRRSLLSTSRAAAMKEVAELVMLARQVGLGADWTPFDVMREECAELGVLDRTNFATEVQRLDLRVQGGRNTREGRLTRHGLDAAIRLLQETLEKVGSSPASA